MIDGYRVSGWEVYLLAMNTSKHHIPHKVLKTLYTDIHQFDWMDMNNDIKATGIIKNYLFSEDAEHVARFYNAAFEEKIVSVLQEFSPDVVQIESVYLTTYMPAIKSNSKAVSVLRMHNIEYHIWHSLANKSKNILKKNYLTNLTKRLKRFERNAWKQYDVVLAITEKDAAHVRKLENVPGRLVAPFSMDTSKISVSDVEKKWVGYHIGAMDWIPNKEGVKWFLTEAWPRIHKAVPKFEFYFAGRKMPGEFTQMNVEGVHCLAEVENAADFIADKKILIVPISSAGGIRVKILEAMAAGKIVISTPYGIKGIEAKMGEHYLTATTPDDFMRAIKWCLKNKPEAEQIAINARELVIKKYDYLMVIKDIITEIDSQMSLRL
jgi:glycosyltransferase involved in cell wall biosynthesis